MLRIDVALKDRAYPVWIGQNLLTDAALWSQYLPDAPVVVVSNDTVAPLYLARLRSALRGSEVHHVLLPDGEAHKTVRNWQRILDFLVSIKAGRDTCLVALGGGVIGDLCGFAAASYMRGVSFVQAPTTLLAQVDASVGGKTGVNHEQGKNLIGAFHQPVAVIADTATFSSLPPREYLAGLAEVLKYGAIGDPGLVDFLQHHASEALALDPETVTHLVRESVRHKAEIVAADEFEAGRRALLNFGHSFAHALETLTAYGALLHGEAVAIGMVIAARLSERRGLCPAGVAERLLRLQSELGLPVSVPDNVATHEMLEAMRLDKKNLQGRQRLVLLRDMGRAVIDHDSTQDEIAQAIDACR